MLSAGSFPVSRRRAGICLPSLGQRDPVTVLGPHHVLQHYYFVSEAHQMGQLGLALLGLGSSVLNRLGYLTLQDPEKVLGLGYYCYVIGHHQCIHH